MWRASSRLNGVCPRLQSSALQQCRSCTQPPKSTAPAAATAAAKGSAPPLTEPLSDSAPPPPPPKSGGGAFWKLLGLGVIGAGGVVGYAWYDPSFRKQVEETVPGGKPALDAAFAYLPPAPGAEVTPAKPTPRAVSSTPGPIISDNKEVMQKGLAKIIKVPEPEPQEKATKNVEKKKTDVNKVETLKTKADEAKKKEAEKKKAEEQAKAKEKSDMVQRVLLEKEAEEAAENAALESILKDMVGEVEEGAKSAISALDVAADATRTHSHKLKSAMEVYTEGENKDKQWQSVCESFEERRRAADKAESLFNEARENLEKLRAAIKEGKSNKVTRKNDALLSAEERLLTLNYDLKRAEAEAGSWPGNDRANSESRLMEDYRDLVKKGREQFRKELESIKPDVRIGRRVGGRMTEEELNSLIAHAHRRIEQLQCQVAEQQALEGERTMAALERQKDADQAEACKRVAREVERLRGEFELEKRRMENAASVTCEKEIRTQLTRQAGAHSDHLTQVLEVQKDTLHRKYEQLIHDRVISERDGMRQEIAGWVTRLKGIEAAIEGRAEMEKLGRKAQELWLACQTLANVIENGKEGAVTWDEALKPLASELDAVREAGNEHPFVSAVLKAVPDEALTRGVWTQDSLIQRFDKVRRMCRRVAMIDETNTSLFRYFLSSVQSFLIVKHRALADSEDVDSSQLTTFMLVDNAAHCLERGDLEQAVRYMNQLTGEARCIASDWLTEARLLLETKQAATALLAHASASGLGSLF